MSTNRHSKATLGVIAALASLLVYQSFALEPAVVATVDLERVFNAVPQHAAAERELAAFGRSLDDRAAALADEIELMEADLRGLAPASQRYEKLSAELMRKSLEYDGYAQFANNRWELERAEALRDIYLDIRDAIAVLSEQNGYDIVILDETVGGLIPRTEEDMKRQIASRRLLFGSKTLDITDRVIAAMSATQ